MFPPFYAVLSRGRGEGGGGMSNLDIHIGGKEEKNNSDSFLLILIIPRNVLLPYVYLEQQPLF